MAPAFDATYKRMDAEIAQRDQLQRERTPRAVRLRDEFLHHYRMLEISDTRQTGLLQAADVLSEIIREGNDISQDGEEILRTMLVGL